MKRFRYPAVASFLFYNVKSLTKLWYCDLIISNGVLNSCGMGKVCNFTARHYASVVYAVVVCPSIHPSVTRRYCTKMAKGKVTLTRPYDSPGRDSVFNDAKNLRKIPSGSPPTGMPNRGGVG